MIDGHAICSYLTFISHNCILSSDLNIVILVTVKPKRDNMLKRMIYEQMLSLFKPSYMLFGHIVFNVWMMTRLKGNNVQSESTPAKQLKLSEHR